MSLNIKIHNFDGPFDLLLHLIKKNKMEIYDISIYEITNQYLQYLNKMEDLDLEITSEFIVMAATLIEIKSKYLLPKLEEKEEEEEDPTKELINKLLEYKKFKAAAQFFKGKQKISGISFSKKPEIIEQKNRKNGEDFLKDVTMLSLYNTYNELMDNYTNKMNGNVEFKGQIYLDKYKIEDKMEYISNRITSNEKCVFSDFIRECSCKLEAVVTFLAILELIKLKTIQAYQCNNFNEIYIERGVINE